MRPPGKASELCVSFMASLHQQRLTDMLNGFAGEGEEVLVAAVGADEAGGADG